MAKKIVNTDNDLQTGAEPTNTTEATSTQAQAPVAEQNKPPIEDKPSVIKTPLVQIGEEKPEDYNDIKTVAAYMAQKVGREIKEPKDIKEIFDEVYGKTQPAVDEKRIKELAALESTVASLPPEIKELVNTYINNGDYRSAIKKTAKMFDVDYSKDAMSFDKNELIRHYNPALSKEQVDDMDDITRSALWNASIAMFNNDKNNFVVSEKTKKQQAEMAERYWADSIERAMSELKKQYPQTGQEQLKKVKEMMADGYSLYDENGYYKPDAAVRIALGEYAPQTISEIVNAYNATRAKELNAAGSAAREEFLATQTGQKPRPSSENNINKINEEVKKRTAHLQEKPLFSNT